MDTKARVNSQLELLMRGTVDVLTLEDLRAKLTACLKGERGPLRVKLGLDPTSPDLHLGHTVVLRKCRQFQDLGHKVVLIIGDGTSAVGDPSGRSKTRPVLTREQIQANCETYFQQAGKVLNLDSSVLEIRYNGEWFYAMSFIDVIRMASRMTVARLLERDDFTKRYKEGSPIALHEMLYPIMQGYDSVMINCDVELGGTDQTFNLLVGRMLMPQYGLEAQVPMTMPLLVGLDGTQKMSKSLGNYIGVTEPSRDIFGKAMSIPDALLRDYFVLATKMPAEEIDALLAPDAHPMVAKKRLAWELVRIYCDEATADHEKSEFERVFSSRELPQDIPVFDAPEPDEQGRYRILELVKATGAAGSGKEARRLVEQGGVKLDDEKVTDPLATVELRPESVLRVGRKVFARFRVGPVE